MIGGLSIWTALRIRGGRSAGGSLTGSGSESVDQEREKLSAGSGSARSDAGSISLRPRSGLAP